MFRMAFCFSLAAFFSNQARAVELTYHCHAQLFHGETLAVEAQKSFPVEGDLCMQIFDLEQKAFSLCPNESEGTIGFGIADENSSQMVKTVADYGVKHLEVKMQSAVDASYLAEMTCRL